MNSETGASSRESSRGSAWTALMSSMWFSDRITDLTECVGPRRFARRREIYSRYEIAEHLDCEVVLAFP